MSPNVIGSKKRKTRATSRITAQLTSRSLSPQNAKKTFPCSCTLRCKGRLKQVTRATYLRHAQFREMDAQKEAEAEQQPMLAPLLENEESESVSPEDDGTIEVLIHSYINLLSR